MTTKPRLSDRQRAFLRAFHDNPAGPAPVDWPAPAILRRWLRRPTFRRAFESLQQTLQLQTDFHLAAAATQAARNLADPAATPDAQRHLAPLLRLAHLRQRFAAAPPQNEPTPDAPTQDSALSTQDSRTKVPPADKHVPGLTFRLADLGKVARDYGYVHRFTTYDQLPEHPRTVEDYQQILSSELRLIFFLKRYTDNTPDKRFQWILDKCHDMIKYNEHHVKQPTKPATPPTA